MVDDGSGGHAGRRVPRYAEANEGLSRPRIRRGGPALQQRGMSGESKSPDGRREVNRFSMLAIRRRRFVLALPNRFAVMSGMSTEAVDAQSQRRGFPRQEERFSVTGGGKSRVLLI